jgi:hypothetical protein
MFRKRVAVWFFGVSMLVAGAGEGGQAALSGGSTSSIELPFTFDGPPPPVPPDVIARDPAGRTTIRAVRVTAPLRIDGQLDDGMYGTVPPISDFIQNDPQEGAPATEKTEVWIFFDRDTIYVAARCWESRPDRMVVNEMRRDSVNIVQNDGFAFGLDTFYDRRNSVIFEVNVLGGRIDAQVTNERQINLDWNPIWELRAARFEGGWAIEAAIPFKSLRYRPGRAQIWGFNARRVNRWKNEVSYLARIPASMTMRGHFQSSLMATLVGLEAPSGSRNLEVKPYGISQVVTDRTTTPIVSRDLRGDWGVDVKYGITQSVTSDFTYNTDFAQVEADEQQVNLTRFSLFFPEKRDFFLENQGTFAFGGGAAFGPAGGGGSGGGVNANPSDTPLLFYSRRIGLNGGRAIPIDAGGRVTGRAGRYSIGLLNIQADDEAASGTRATNFSVARVKRDFLRKSSVGAIFTGRSIGQNGAGSNEAYGIDGTFAFYDNLSINTYWAQTRTDHLAGEDTSYRGQLDYAGDRYGVQVERLVVGRHFNPETGFLRRGDMRRSFGQFRFSPRPARSTRIRRLFSMGSLAYVENGAGQLETRDWDGEFAVEFQNSDRFFVGYSNTYELLPQPFTVATGVTLPVRGYDFASVRTGFNLGPGRRVAGSLAIEHGTFYSGHKTTFSWNRGRVNVTPQLSVEPGVSIDWVDLLEGSFMSRLVGSRVTYTVTPLMFASALVQYNSNGNVVAANVRLRWEYSPGSELFVVFNEQRDTLARGFPGLANRAFIVKVNRLFRL